VLAGAGAATAFGLGAATALSFTATLARTTRFGTRGTGFLPARLTTSSLSARSASALPFAATFARTAGFGTFGAPLFTTRSTAPVLSLVTTATSKTRLTTAMLGVVPAVMGLVVSAVMPAVMCLLVSAVMPAVMGLLVSAAMLALVAAVMGGMAAARAAVVNRAVPVITAFAVGIVAGRGVASSAAPVMVLVIALGVRRRYAGYEQTAQRQQGRQEGRPPWSDH
jgi:hypothetical protein